MGYVSVGMHIAKQKPALAHLGQAAQLGWLGGHIRAEGDAGGGRCLLVLCIHGSPPRVLALFFMTKNGYIPKSLQTCSCILVLPA